MVCAVGGGPGGGQAPQAGKFAGVDGGRGRPQAESGAGFDLHGHQARPGAREGGDAGTNRRTVPGQWARRLCGGGSRGL